MWVFDGEQWTDEAGVAREHEHENALPLWDETMPELQVIEHLPPTRPANVPPLPLP